MLTSAMKLVTSAIYVFKLGNTLQVCYLQFKPLISPALLPTIFAIDQTIFVL